MNKKSIKFDNWPFADGEKVKLIKISKPYADKGLWYINAAYFSEDSRQVRWLKQYFEDLHLLICGSYYTNGERQDTEDWDVLAIQISKQAIENRRPAPYLKRDTIGQNQFDYYTFGISWQGNYLIIPLWELLRAVLAPDVFWLNQVILFDSIDTRIIFENGSNNARMLFLPDVHAKYVKMDEKIKHAAWVLSNPQIYEMISQCYLNIKNGNGVKFEFLFDELYFKAKVEKKDRNVYIKEILAVSKKNIKCGHIIVEHPSLVQYEKDGIEKEKKWTPVGENYSELSLVSDKTSKHNVVDMERYDAILSEYDSPLKIERIRRKKTGGSIVSLNTFLVDVEGKGKRTTADTGGLNMVPQLEFANKISEKLQGLFAEMNAVLTMMRDREEIDILQYHSAALAIHFSYGSACTNTNGDLRQYLIGQIRAKYNNREARLIEIEKDKPSLSTLLLVSNEVQNWRLICHKVLKGLIRNSGAWPNLEDFGFDNLEIYKFKHTEIEVRKKEERIFKSLYFGKKK